MSLVRLNIKSRIELETRVLAAALKQSFERGDTAGVSLAHKQLFLLLKDAQKPSNGDQSGETMRVEPDSGEVAEISTAAAEAPEYAASMGQAPNMEFAQEMRPLESYAVPDVSQPETIDVQPPQEEPEVQGLYAPPQGMLDGEAHAAIDDEDEYENETDETPPYQSSEPEPLQFAPAAEDDRWRRPPMESSPPQSYTSSPPPAQSDADVLAELQAQYGARRHDLSMPSSRQQTADLPLSEVMAAAAQAAAAQAAAAQMAPIEPAGHEQDSGEPPADHVTDTSEKPVFNDEDSDTISFEDDEPGHEPQDEAEPASSLEAQESIAPDDESLSYEQDIEPAAQDEAEEIAEQPQEWEEPAAQEEHEAREAAQEEEPATSDESEFAETEPPQSPVEHEEFAASPVEEAEPEPVAHEAPEAVTPEPEASEPEAEPEVSPEAQRAFLELAAMMGEASLPDDLPPPPKAVPEKPKEAFKRSSSREFSTEVKKQPSELIEREPSNIYELLGVSQMSPFEVIHRTFLRKVRKILLTIEREGKSFQQLSKLRKIWIAHDILTDPVTRTDYDFRDLGLRGDGEAIVPHAPEDRQQARMNNRTPLRIGELLQCAGLLESAELEIACDMHKAMPEMQFGAFLVRQGFIQPRDLESVLLGQKLLREGLITVAQFQVAMDLAQSRGTLISETLLERNYITEQELEKYVESSASEMASMVPPPPPPIQIVVPPKDAPPKEVEPPQKPEINLSSASPTWKDQIDWTESAEGSGATSEAPSEGAGERQGLGALLSGIEAPKAVQSDSEAEEKVKLRLSDAVPSWKDQLDWSEPEEAATEAPGGATDENQQAAQPRALKLGNAVPSWKDQLDWGAPGDAEAAESAQEAPEESEVDESDEGVEIDFEQSSGEHDALEGEEHAEPNQEDQDAYLGQLLQSTDIFDKSAESAIPGEADEESEDPHKGDRKHRGRDRRKKPRK